MTRLDLSDGLPAEIVMETRTKQLDDHHSFLFEEMGKVVYLNGNYYIRYEESPDNEDNKQVTVTVKITPEGKVHLIRYGETTTRLIFDSQNETESNYNTQAGIMPLTVKTNDLKISYYDRPFAGRVDVDYEIFMGRELIGSYKIRLRFTT